MDQVIACKMQQLSRGYVVRIRECHGGTTEGRFDNVMSKMIAGRRPSQELIKDVMELGQFDAASTIARVACLHGTNFAKGWLGAIHSQYMIEGRPGYVDGASLTGYVLGLFEHANTDYDFVTTFSAILPDILGRLNTNIGMSQAEFNLWDGAIGTAVKEWAQKACVVKVFASTVETIADGFQNQQNINMYVNAIMAHMFYAKIQPLQCAGYKKLACMAALLRENPAALNR